MKNFSRFHICLTLLIVLQLVSNTVIAQSTENTIFRNITPDEGLPITSVTGVAQDSYGYIWIGSWYGVYRYDGQTFEKMSPEGRYMETDDKGGVWISYERGGPLAYYNSVQDSLHIFDVDIDLGWYPRVKIDAAGRVWSESGENQALFLFNESLQAFEPDSTQEPGQSYNIIAHADSSITYYYQNADDEWRLGHRTYGGTHNFQILPLDQNNPDPSLRVHATSLRLIGYKDNGLLFVNEFGWATRESLHDDWHFVRSPNQDLLRDISDVILHNDDQLWVHKTNSLIKIDIETGEYTTYVHNPLNPKSLISFNQINAGSELFIDRQEVLWISSFASGISRLNLYESDFGLLRNDEGTPHLDIISALELEDGSFWIGARSESRGLMHFDSSGSLIERYTGSFSNSVDPGKSVGEELSSPFAWSLGAGSDGSTWAGTGFPSATEGGLNRIRPGSNEITRFKHNPVDEASLPGNWVRTIFEDDSGRIWAGTGSGIAWIDPETEIVTRPESPEDLGVDIRNPDWIIPSNSGDIILSYESNKYYRINHVDLTIEPIDLSIESDHFTRIIAQDRNEQFWVANPEGLGIVNTSMNSIEKWYHIDDYDLPITNFSGLQFDRNNNAWLSSDNGILKMNLDSETFTHYPYERGLQGHIFIGRVTYQGPSGRLYFGDTGGINIFHPDEIIENPHPPQMVFTNLSLDGNQIQFGPDQPIESPIEIADEIVVQPDILSVSIEFGAMHFAANESNQYQYQLVGFDDSWRDGGTIGQATYTNLPQGDYTFRIRGSNLDGVWSDGSKSISLAVLPPWYRTWWAYGFYFILFIAGIIATDRVQRRRVQQKEREKAREKELAQAKEIEKAYKNLEVAHEDLKAAQDQLVQQEKLASLGQLTAGIAHEIKNPLNFVNNFSDLSVELVEEAREEVRRQTADVKRETKESPFEGGSERSEQGDDTSDERTLILEILDDIEANLKTIHKHGTRADGIVKSMLQHSRGGDGRMEPTPLNPLIKEYVNLAFHGMRAGKDPIEVNIELDLNEKAGEVPLVAEDFSRVILNLCNNAFDAMREKALSPSPSPSGIGVPEGQGEGEYVPKLTVHTVRDCDTVTIEIQDNGPGIPEEIKDKILQPFFTTKKGTAGTGLGLSITNDIIKAHGGNLEVNSDNEGTSFVIQLLNTG